MITDESIDIRRIKNRIIIIGIASGIEIQAPGADLSRVEGWGTNLHGTEAKLARCVPVLVSNGQLEIIDYGLFGSYENLADFDSEDAAVFDDLCPWSPFSIHLESFSSLGAPDFRILVEFSFGDRVVHPMRCGSFLRLEGRPYRIEESTRQLFDLIAKTNDWRSDEKTDLPRILERWGEIRDLLGRSAGLDLDQYLRGEEVIVPESLQLDLRVSEDDSISVVPSFDQVPDLAMHREYLRFAEVQSIYNLQREGGRLRVIIRPEVGEALRNVRQMRRLRGPARERLLLSPRSLLSDSPDGAVVDLSRFGPRVRGIGPYPASVRAFIPSGEVWTEIDELNEATPGGAGPREPRPAVVLEWVDHDGAVTTLPLASRDAALSLRGRLADARDRQQPTIEYETLRLPTEGDLIGQLDRVIEALPAVAEADHLPAGGTSDINLRRPKDRGMGILIHENQENADYEEAVAPESPYRENLPLPAALKREVTIKEHQREGILWLQRSLAAGRRNGVLLADDMGLGKTLQVLAFLAWVIESPYSETLGADCGPYDPILVVAPTVLLEDLGWRGQIDRFLERSCFLPLTVLHGPTLQGLRTRAGVERQEARALLDIEQIRHNRLIITNYETLVNYQFSLTEIQWSVVVADEAHVFKDPGTKVSWAMKALKARFRVALTGTPVQNRLLDLWNLVDYLQPGSVLGSEREFRSHFEHTADSDPAAEQAKVSKLRDLLEIGKPSGLLLRRDKETQLPDLPSKTRKTIKVTLSEAQRQLHQRAVQLLRNEVSGKGSLALLSSLSKIYQHPALAGVGSPEDSIPLLLQNCPKLEGLLGILREVRLRGEKALIFAVFRDMQAILKRTIDHEFGLDVDIMNGDASGSVGPLSKHRSGLLQRFGAKHGFNVLILSPKVAGVGLTIVEANHVIHYGRWWNPAIEDQATDRVHRIGQERDVYVYNLVACDPAGRFQTFDEKLDGLIERKRIRAADFLRAREDEAVLREELFRSLSENLSPGEDSIAGPSLPGFTDLAGILGLSSQERRCLIANLLKREGRNTLLTPRRASRGIDLVALGSGEALLIRVRQDGDDLSAIAAAMEELQSGAEFHLRSTFAEALRGRDVTLCFAVLEEPDRQLKKLAKQGGVTLLGGGELMRRLERASISSADAGGDDVESADSLGEMREWALRSGGDQEGAGLAAT